MLEYSIHSILLLLLTLYYLGFVYGMLVVILFVHIFDYVLDKFGYIRLVYGDLAFVYQEEKHIFNVGGYFEIDKIKTEEFKQKFYER